MDEKRQKELISQIVKGTEKVLDEGLETLKGVQALNNYPTIEQKYKEINSKIGRMIDLKNGAPSKFVGTTLGFTRDKIKSTYDSSYEVD